MIETDDKRLTAAEETFRCFGGMLRTSQALQHGIHRRTLYAMRDAGMIKQLERGLYRLAELPPLSAPDLVTVARRVPNSVICLVSALRFHGITTQIPDSVQIANKRGAGKPRLTQPPIKMHWFSSEAFTAGVQEHYIDETVVRVYCPEKTLADCFKYRNKIGMDTVLEALTLYRDQGKPRTKRLLRFARICRVEKIMWPYLETTLR